MKTILEQLKDFEQSEIRKFIEEMVQKELNYFTKEKTKEINDFLKGTGWVFYGKREPEQHTNNSGGFYFAAFGANKQLMFNNSEMNISYWVGREFDLSADLERCHKEAQLEVEKENKKIQLFNEKKKYWAQQIQTMTSDQIAETLAKLCMPDENDEDYDYDDYDDDDYDDDEY